MAQIFTFRKLGILSLALASAAANAQTLHKPLAPVAGKQVLPILTNSAETGQLPPNTPMQVTVSFGPRDASAFQNFADAVSTPGNPQWGNFITPEEVGSRFGADQDIRRQMKNYLQASGLSTVLDNPNGLAITVKGTATQVQNAFGTTLATYTTVNPATLQTTRFFANSLPIRVPANLQPYIVDVSGMENFTKPQPLNTIGPIRTRYAYNYTNLVATYTGIGRTVGISNWDGYRLTNATAYVQNYGFPTPIANGKPSNVTKVIVTADGETATQNIEGDIDVQMVLAMVPQANVRIYDGSSGGSQLGGDLIGVLSAETAENLADVITESYGWQESESTYTAAHNQHLSMTAQGITYMAASGDDGTALGATRSGNGLPFDYPDFDPEVLSVGGTWLETDGTGNRLSEVTWSGGGGGWSTDPASFNSRPSWQVGNGVPSVATTGNYRLVPDVALHSSTGANGAAYVFAYSGQFYGGSGTSFASPIFAGMLAGVEQDLITAYGALPPNGSGKQRLGRIANFIYAQNGRSDVWLDITSGSNGTLKNGQTSNAVPGWDTATGWGAPNLGNMLLSFIPGITSTSPATVNTGGPQFSLTVNGSNFYQGAVVKLNGVALSTSYVSGSQLTATVPAGLIASAGSYPITVLNAEFGGAAGGSGTLQVKTQSVTISGNLSLNDYAVSPTGLSAKVDLLQGGVIVESHTVALGAGGSFSFSTNLKGSTTLIAKVSHWLAKSLGAVNIQSNAISGLAGALFNGDCNEDNGVDVADYAVFAAAYGSFQGDANYVADADLNGDGGVDTADYAIFAANYGLFGDS